jgi:hypothetical protein
MPRLAPEDIVAASLRDLELGEVVCLPSLEETDRLVSRDEAERCCCIQVRKRKPAERYLWLLDPFQKGSARLSGGREVALLLGLHACASQPGDVR